METARSNFLKGGYHALRAGGCPFAAYVVPPGKEISGRDASEVNLSERYFEKTRMLQKIRSYYERFLIPKLKRTW